jgi:hypothetical protein
MKNFIFVALGLVLLGAGCFITTDLPDPPIEDPQSVDEVPYGDEGVGDEIPYGDDGLGGEGVPYGDDGIGDEVTLSGVTIVDQIVQTLMACPFSDSAQPGDRIECNHGWTNVGFVDEQGREIWLDGYGCSVTEFEVYESDTEYELDCTDEILIGETYTFYGSLGWSVEPSYIGYENGRWLLSDIVLVD